MTSSDALAQAELARTLLHDAEDLLAIDWDPFHAMDLTVAMLEAKKAGLGEFKPLVHFMNAVEALRADEELGPWLYRGAAQIGWTATQLHKALGVTLKNLRSIDELIMSWLEDYPVDRDVELLFGPVGLGVYGLEHTSEERGRQIVSASLRVIEERLERSADGAAAFVRLTAAMWDAPGASRRKGWRSVGVAHGNAGLAAFLAAVSHGGTDLADRAQAMLQEVARWLVSIASPTSDYVFDSFREDTTEDGRPQTGRGRSSWCHGDPGIALALRSVARVLHVRELAEQVSACSEAAAMAVLRRPVRLAGIRDCCLCHGAAFLYYFGGRISEFGAHVADAFADDWYSSIRAHRSHGPIIYQGPDGKRRDASFLNGDSGVVCVLTRTLHGGPSSWERLLLTV
jgi:hypothetical protein